MMQRIVPTWIPGRFGLDRAGRHVGSATLLTRRSAYPGSRSTQFDGRSEDRVDAGHFAEAAALLVRAYAISPSSTLLYNMGRAYQQAGDRNNAIDAYQRYLASESAPSDEGAIRRTIQQLQDEIAKEGALAERAEREERGAAAGCVALSSASPTTCSLCLEFNVRRMRVAANA